MAVYQLRTTQPLSMLVRKGHKYSEADVLEIGALGRTALSRRISVEMQVDWLHSYLVERWKASKKQSTPPVSPDRAQARILLDAALGASVVSVVQNFQANGPLELMSVQRSLEAVVDAGVVNGIGIHEGKHGQAGREHRGFRRTIRGPRRESLTVRMSFITINVVFSARDRDLICEPASRSSDGGIA